MGDVFSAMVTQAKIAEERGLVAVIARMLKERERRRERRAVHRRHRAQRERDAGEEDASLEILLRKSQQFQPRCREVGGLRKLRADTVLQQAMPASTLESRRCQGSQAGMS